MKHKTQNILVTGGAGFIGHHLCQYLINQGHTVTAIDNLITGSRKNLENLQKNPRFRFIHHDINKQLPNFQHHFTQIYHLACPTGVDNLLHMAEDMLLTSTLGTYQILELACRHKSRFLFSSSSEVYGDSEITPQTEKYYGHVDPVGKRSPYEEGKRVAESLIRSYFRHRNLDAVIVRIFNTYGPEFTATDQRVIPRFITQAIALRPLTICGQGAQKRTFSYISDTLAALTLVMDSGQSGEVYNAGSTKQISIKELAQLIIRITKSKSPINFVSRPNHDHEGRLPNIEKIGNLGWRVRVHLTPGLILSCNSLKNYLL